MKTRNSVVIGIGGAGGQVIQNIKKNHTDSLYPSSQEKPTLLYIDTDEDSISHRQKGNCGLQKNEILLIDIENKASFKNWMFHRVDWLSKASLEKIQLPMSGAGGNKAIGRAIFAYNYRIIRERISKLIEFLNPIDQMDFYLVYSLMGGTGAGIFLEVARLIELIANKHKQSNADLNSNFYHFALTPDCFQSVEMPDNLKQKMRANAFGCLLDLEILKKSYKPYPNQQPSEDNFYFDFLGQFKTLPQTDWGINLVGAEPGETIHNCLSKLAEYIEFSIYQPSLSGFRNKLFCQINMDYLLNQPFCESVFFEKGGNKRLAQFIPIYSAFGYSSIKLNPSHLDLTVGINYLLADCFLGRYLLRISKLTLEKKLKIIGDSLVNIGLQESSLSQTLDDLSGFGVIKDLEKRLETELLIRGAIDLGGVCEKEYIAKFNQAFNELKSVQFQANVKTECLKMLGNICSQISTFITELIDQHGINTSIELLSELVGCLNKSVEMLCEFGSKQELKSFDENGAFGQIGMADKCFFPFFRKRLGKKARASASEASLKELKRRANLVYLPEIINMFRQVINYCNGELINKCQRINSFLRQVRSDLATKNHLNNGASEGCQQGSVDGHVIFLRSKYNKNCDILEAAWHVVAPLAFDRINLDFSFDNLRMFYEEVGRALSANLNIFRVSLGTLLSGQDLAVMDVTSFSKKLQVSIYNCLMGTGWDFNHLQGASDILLSECNEDERVEYFEMLAQMCAPSQVSHFSGVGGGFVCCGHNDYDFISNYLNLFKSPAITLAMSSNYKDVIGAGTLFFYFNPFLIFGIEDLYAYEQLSEYREFFHLDYEHHKKNIDEILESIKSN